LYIPGMNETEMSNQAQQWAERAQDLQEQARNWKQQFSDRARQAFETSDHFVHENAWMTIGIAALAGCAVGLLLGRLRD
jgi:ElaB/YqjD/DUF883 family membrane-anchored ribosome-binding protein